MPLLPRPCGPNFGAGFLSVSRLAPRLLKRLVVLRWLWLRLGNFTPMMGRLSCILAVFTAVNLWKRKPWRRSGIFLWTSLFLATVSQPCSFLRMISNHLATRMSLSAKLQLALELWRRKLWTSVQILDLGDLEDFDMVLQCEHCLWYLPFYIAELKFLILANFALLLPGLLGGWSWTWQCFGVRALFPCHFGRGVQFLFWRSMHFRVRQSLSSSSSSSSFLGCHECGVAHWQGCSSAVGVIVLGAARNSSSNFNYSLRLLIAGSAWFC